MICWGSNCSLAQLIKEEIYQGGRWGSTILMTSRSTSGCKAQSKATDLQITRSATQGFRCTNTSRSALSLAKRQVGQQLWKKFKPHALYVALVSSLCYFSLQLLSVWSSPGTGSVVGEQVRVPIFPARTSLRRSQSRGLFRPAPTSSTHTDI